MFPDYFGNISSAIPPPHSWSAASVSALSTPKQLLILLHGYGANGDDLIGLTPIIQQRFPNMVFVAPHAPFACAMNPHGRQWFGLEGYNPMAPDLQAIRLAAADISQALCQYIQHIADKHGCALDNVALLGFSQGTMVALNASFHLPLPLAAVIGFSGALLHTTKPTTPTSPLLLIHGDQDPVVPIQASQTAYQQCQDWQISAQFIPRHGLGHGIDDTGLQAAITFLADSFNQNVCFSKNDNRPESD